MKKIGILTLPIKTNYGGILQAYALLILLRQLGYDAWFIRRRWNSEHQSLLHLLQKKFYHTFIIRKFNSFINTYIQPQTAIIDTRAKIQRLYNEGQFKGFVVGSDQVWRMRNVKGVGLNYFLDFVIDNETKRIAYAASFGVDYWDDDSQDDESIFKVRELLKRFNGISVREDSGIDICQNIFDVKAVHVLDPTLMLTTADYQRLLHFHQRPQPYLAAYILDVTPAKRRIVEQTARQLGLSVRWVNEYRYSFITHIPFMLRELFKPSVQEWISSIANAQFVVTDSFHGTAFSIVFSRPFATIGNVRRGMTRFQSLLSQLELSSRLVDEDASTLPTDDVNYKTVNILLENQRERSKQFIIETIQ